MQSSLIRLCRKPALAGPALALALLLVFSAGAEDKAPRESACYGSTAKGRLEGGAKLPASGPNFSAYSDLGRTLGRTYVQSRVRDAVAAAYKSLETSAPGKVFVYGETGLKQGGPFSPHKTHQNGLSVDFMVPVVKGGKSVALPCGVTNKWGYSIEFDEKGRYKEYAIDFPAMAAHLAALADAAEKGGIGISRVIFDPKLKSLLFATEQGAELQTRLSFSTRRAWVRHDEHYHVDFACPCKPIGG